jgi:hypothetical protein
MINQSRKHFFRSTSIIVLLLGMVIFGAVQQADAAMLPATSIEFELSGGGSINFTGGLNPLIGSGIISTSVTGNYEGSQLPLVINNGRFSFTTGAFMGRDDDTWTFGPGGTLSLIGGVNESGINIADGTVLMSGSFIGPITVVRAFGADTFSINIGSGSFSDSKNPILASYFGLSESPFTGVFTIVFWATTGKENSLTSTSVDTGTLINYPVSSVPVPPSLLLLGSGLAGFIVLRRKASKK